MFKVRHRCTKGCTVSQLVEDSELIELDLRDLVRFICPLCGGSLMYIMIVDKKYEEDKKK